METHYIPENRFPLEIKKNIFVLGNYFFNLFLIIGDTRTALFEVGVSAIVDRVIAQLDGLGVRPDVIISSHPHSDHITGLPGLGQKYPDARVVVAQGAKEFLEHPKAGPLMIKEDGFMSKRLAHFKITPGRPPLEKIPCLDSARVIQDKESIDLGRITLDLVKVDGHSPGSLMGILKKERIVFCADSLGFHFPGRGFLPLFFTHAGAYLSCLNIIKDFDPQVVCPAHQGPLTGDAARLGIQASLATTLEIIKKIKASSLPDETLARDMFKQSYKDEFTLYTQENILNCARLLVKRAKEMT